MYLQKSVQGSVVVIVVVEEREKDSSNNKDAENMAQLLCSAWMRLNTCDSCGSCMYLVEADDVDDPGAEPRGGRGFLSHELRVKLRVAEVLVPHAPHRGLGDVLLVEVHQSLQEVVHLDVHFVIERCHLSASDYVSFRFEIVSKSRAK